MVPAPSGPAFRDAVPSADELPQRALQLLGRGDLHGYRELFAQVGAIGDVHARYRVGMQLVELGLEARAGAPSEGLTALLEASAAGALELLEREPSEPRLLERAGVLLSELGSLDAAGLLLEAAGRLDPSLGGLPDGPRELAERRLRAGAGGPQGVVPPSADPGRMERSARALEIATRAQPARGLRLSLCMIVRDEQEMLPRCLEAAAGAVDEIVIVDTGSRDQTIEIARSFGARVIERPWTGSFAEARNASFDAANGDWLIYLDADEVLVREDAALLRALTGRTWREAFYLSETSYTGDAEEGSAVVHNALRMFRNRPEYRFEGRLHEQIAHRLPGYLPERFEAVDVRVEHFGYLGTVRDARQKSRRNIELLQLQMDEGDTTPFLRFNLGCEHASAGERVAALEQFEQAWQALEGQADRESHKFLPALLSRLVKALRLCDRLQDARTHASQGLELFPDFTDLVFEQALIARALSEHERAIERCERCLEMGDAPRRYTATVGTGSYLPMLQLAELKQERGDSAAAIEMLERCVSEYPQFLQARFLLATALYEAGDTSAAEGHFRNVLEHRPKSGRAHVALAETLLAQGRYDDAAVEASKLDGDHPLAATACRTELFARIAGADFDGAQAALARASDTGMADDELALFLGWEQLARTGETKIEPAGEVLPQLAVLLEALLRVQDFKGFEKLLGLLERAPLDERERRELLAEMYMRRGFPASAAEEWMSVCRGEPDTRALVGLARVAAVRGMARETGEFAAAALAREPENEMAAGLLVQVGGDASSFHGPRR
jgi:tetratricopeptide (TPR) repeat protein